MQYLIISLAGAGALVLGILVYAGVLLHQARARIAALESALAESYRQLDAQRAELDAVTSGAQFASATALGIIRCVNYLSDALYEINQIKPSGNVARRLAISDQIRQRLEKRVQGLGTDLQVVMIDGAFSIEPAIVNQLEAFKDSLQDKLDTADRYTPAQCKGQRRNDYLIKELIEGWESEQTKGGTLVTYCENQNISIRTFKRYKKVYQNRRLDLFVFDDCDALNRQTFTDE